MCYIAHTPTLIESTKKKNFKLYFNFAPIQFVQILISSISHVLDKPLFFWSA